MIKKITLLGLVALLMPSCESVDENVVLFDEVSTEKVVKLANEEQSPTCAVHLKLAYATEENGHKAQVINEIIKKRLLNMHDLTMKQAIDSFANSYTESYRQNFRPLYNQDRTDSTKRSWYEYHYVITSQTQQGGKGTTAYIATIDYFEGGAHGTNMQQTIIFDSKTGEELTLDNIFVKGYEKTLTTILLQALQEKLDVGSMEELRNKGYLRNIKMFPSKNFILNDETITFIYNPHEIAPYDKGSMELTISLSSLNSILNKEYQ